MAGAVGRHGSAGSMQHCTSPSRSATCSLRPGPGRPAPGPCSLESRLSSPRDATGSGARQACIARALEDLHPAVSSTDAPAAKPKRGKPSKLDSLLQASEQFGRRFFIPAAEVDAFRENHNVTQEELLNALIQPASTLAVTPVSAYHVGAAGLGASGSIYIGVNMEFAGRPLNSSVHAEQFLVANAAIHGERKLEVLAVSAAPCGHCRQFFCELPDAGSVRFLFGKTKGRGRQPVTTLEKLLPLRFGPEDLMDDPSAPRMLEAQQDAPLLRQGDLDLAGGEADAELVEAALAELSESYAPYTHCHAAVALRLEGGGVVAGRYLESAAYNPSLGPLQAAIVAATVRGMAHSQIVSALLVENSCGPMSHEQDVRNLLRCCTGGATLQVATYARAVPRGS